MKEDTNSTTLAGESFLFLSLPRHDGEYTSTPWQIARVIATDNPVFFVDNPFTFSDLLSGFFKKQIRKRIRAMWGKKSEKIEDVEVIYPPFIFPINFLPKGRLYNFLSQLNQKLVAARINKVLKQKKVSHLIFVNSFNFYLPELYQFVNSEVRLKIYHCIDPMVKAFTLKHGAYLQDRAAREADFVVSTAPALQSQFTNRGVVKSYLVPNAANFDLFVNARHTEIHPSVAGIKGKTIGYLGNIERRTDFDLLLAVLELLPEWQLIMAGPVDRQYIPVEFLNHPRVYLTGIVPHKDAASVIKRFDVAIIPFKQDEVSNGIYPLKLFEYLATAKPVVSTNFNAEILMSLSAVVHLADSAREFADSILVAYTTDSDEKQHQRVQVASENTWHHRARLFKSITSIEFNYKYKLSDVAKGENKKQPQT